MGRLVDGQWVDQWYDTENNGGRFVRESAQLRDWLTSEGQTGPEGQPAHPAEAKRYHLYVSLACPWAHRTLIMRALKGLDQLLDVSVVSWLMKENGWTYDPSTGSTGDPVNHADYHHQLYTMTDAHYTGRVTVPVLWDKREQRIVNNESADIMRILNQAFDGLTGNTLDLYPQPLREDIDRINEQVYHQVNNGVYKAGFATTQAAYEEAFDALFEALDKLENRLGQQRYLVGPYLTEADWRLFTTLVRFDAVYVGHFKCNQRRIEDYPHLSNYLRELYQWPGVAQTVNFHHIKSHYYASHDMINPTGIVPKGPLLELERPHDRARFEGVGIWQRTA
ncbi:glutathione-dependent reductase [Terasakiispira papahanaumokuakeensis]|uniref:Glutathione-dependent reductase n=1 Tax=Terasakiispira papahanaumokuakeensis TaxID=197479 RepID=A0A1E2VAR6_9GAMM|nr:glutathione S-transferase family protein [Terasakiispira papahanaumokuakeensis]ODC04109.1 glutathione-dependent reductase [Terasakiispira papahanaumokuakeensis]